MRSMGKTFTHMAMLEVNGSYIQMRCIKETYIHGAMSVVDDTVAHGAMLTANVLNAIQIQYGLETCSQSVKLDVM